MILKRIGLSVLFVLAVFCSQAQITVTPNAVAAQLAAKLIGSGVNISNETLNCPALASGEFVVTASNLGLDSGIVLTSGAAASTTATSSDGMNGPVAIATNSNMAPGDPDLTILAGQQTEDACILEFDFETTGDSVRFNYVFGSAEYRGFTCSNFNDVFGFFLSGPGIAGPYSNGAINIATVPGSGGTCPVGVSTIYCPDTVDGPNANPPNNNPQCCGPFNNGPTSCHATTVGCGMFTNPFDTCPFFVCNSGGSTVTYPGFTTVLTAEARIIPCTTYHFKLAIADAFDDALDSGVMLEAGSFSANAVGLDLKANLTSLSGNPVLIEGCDSLKIDVKIEKFGIPTFDTINFVIQGSAINNVDYPFLNDTIVFSPDPADTVRTICISAYQDNIPEGTETIVLFLQNFCSTALADSLVIEIVDSLGADFIVSNALNQPPNDSVCLGTAFIFTPLVFPIQGVGPLAYSWDFGDGTTVSNASAVNQIKNYPNPGTYTVWLYVTDTAGCMDSAMHTVYVDEPPYVELSATPLEICVGEKVQFIDSIAKHTFNWVYDFDDGVILSGLHNPTHIFEKSGVYNVTLTGQYLICDDETKDVTITVKDFPLINLGEDKVLCPGLDTVALLENIENPNQIMNWSTGETAPSIEATKTGRYWAMVDNDGCSTTDSIWVKRDCYLNIPNSFSPNNDGRNDYFIPRQLLSSGVIEFDMKIFNRWGETIFKTDKIDGRGWDGKFGGKEQSTGVFVYQIVARWRNGYQNSFRGNVTLLR